MATWDDVRRIVLPLPETVELDAGGTPQWKTKGKLLCWERPLRAGELAALGAAAPAGPILAVRVPDLGVKDALLGDDPGTYFTTPHFDGYSMVLVLLERIGVPELSELLVEAWIARAPKRVAAEWLSRR